MLYRSTWIYLHNFFKCHLMLPVLLSIRASVTFAAYLEASSSKISGQSGSQEAKAVAVAL